ncbi:biphenyl 2,3-dioxygenase [Loktanella sp. 3ANDIMAR09]|uniref:multicopper oxidase domain-containing protein n=1 Tax=Loktanella sp. 3ANDIMAR09 TaxID=1225657 RepID=UPI00070785E7|nr:multicopper oxidase domain-containing protein [Loktanella sp. 3ANDIMAR09]KQI67675.1 biphenyl 2,3-dioxygenase [Loktanella sp. 3ANDIMAR09]
MAALPAQVTAETGKQLTYPQLLDATASRQFRLTAQAGTTRFDGGAATQTQGYNQSYLGPTVRVMADADTQARVNNQLRAPVSAHWHGLLVPGDVDGGPHQAIAPGQSWHPVLSLDQPPATAWYHSHVHGTTAEQVMFGLAGVLHVTDGSDDSRGLPSTYGVDDLTLVLQDRQFNWRGRMTYDSGMHEAMNGFVGDTMVVNGQIGATAAVPQGIVRCRLVNGSNARIYQLSLSDNRPMHLIATDGGYLDRPVALNAFFLAPGERAEVLVDFTSGTNCSLVSENIANSAMGGMMGGRSGGQFVVLPFAIDTTLPTRIDGLPDSLDGALPNLDITGASVRGFSLDMSMGMGMMMTRSNEQFSINNAAFDESALNFAVAHNSLERWIVQGDLMMHPFHIHGVRFQVLSENGQRPRPENRGWKDTVLVNGQVELAVRFEKLASRSAPYMYHCHILEHEDGGMMGQFSVS